VVMDMDAENYLWHQHYICTNLSMFWWEGCQHSQLFPQDIHTGKKEAPTIPTTPPHASKRGRGRTGESRGILIISN